jgi:hypothetical protein
MFDLQLVQTTAHEAMHKPSLPEIVLIPTAAQYG